MKNYINKMSWTNKIILSAILIGAISNPWSVGYIDYALEIFSKYFVEYSKYAFVASLVLLAIVNIYTMYAGREKINVPIKSAKTKTAGKFLEA